MNYTWREITGRPEEIRQAIKKELRAVIDEQPVTDSEKPGSTYAVNIRVDFSRTAETRPGQYVVYIPVTLAIQVHANSAEHAQKIGEQLRDCTADWDCLTEDVSIDVADLPEIDDDEEDWCAELRAALEGDGISPALYTEREPVTVRDFYAEEPQ